MVNKVISTYKHANFLRNVLFIVFVFCIIFAMCMVPARSGVQNRLVMKNDFESMESLLPDSLLGSLTQKKAHSGRFSVCVDSAHEYSTGYRIRLGDVFTKKPRKLRLSAWAWVANFKDDATLVLAISAPDNSSNIIFTKSIYLADRLMYGSWRRMERDLDLPSEISTNSYLSVYAWRAGATNPVYIDDWELYEIR